MESMGWEMKLLSFLNQASTFFLGFWSAKGPRFQVPARKWLRLGEAYLPLFLGAYSRRRVYCSERKEGGSHFDDAFFGEMLIVQLAF